MREILFKAKRIDNGEWVEGFVAYPHCTDTEKGVQTYYFYEIKNGQSYQRIVSADTICQYTGLTDKNGNKIWENDIVKQTFYKLYGIDYGMGNVTEEIDGNETGVVTITASKGTCIKRPYQNVWIDGEQVANNKRVSTNKNVVSYRSEVIGNIFDNAELLKEGSE